MLRDGELDGARVLSRPFVRLMTREVTVGGLGAHEDPLVAHHYALGWGKPGVASPASPASFGHGGASGTRLWVDPEHDLVFAYLSGSWGLPARADRRRRARGLRRPAVASARVPRHPPRRGPGLRGGRRRLRAGAAGLPGRRRRDDRRAPRPPPRPDHPRAGRRDGEADPAAGAGRGQDPRARARRGDAREARRHGALGGAARRHGRVDPPPRRLGRRRRRRRRPSTGSTPFAPCPRPTGSCVRAAAWSWPGTGATSPSRGSRRWATWSTASRRMSRRSATPGGRIAWRAAPCSNRSNPRTSATSSR